MRGFARLGGARVHTLEAVVIMSSITETVPVPAHDVTSPSASLIAEKPHAKKSVPPEFSWDSVLQYERPYFRWKYRIGRTFSVLLLVAAAPAIAILALLVRLTSRGPGLYHQRRLGRHGRVFTIHKLRTMRQDAERSTGAVWASPDDDRTTRFGRFLRKTHLDELPQLWNVARGEMALVGPRPERPELAQRLAARLPDYALRLAVRPGIAGLAQVNLPPDTDLESVRRKLVLDLEYIRTAGAILDVRILGWSAFRLLGISAERLTRWFGLERSVPSERSARSPRRKSPQAARRGRAYRPR